MPIVFWHWWVLAATLMAMELFAPTTLFLWLGAAATVVGVILYAAPELSWQWQVVAFAVLAVVGVIAWRQLAPASALGEDAPVLNERARQYVGQTYTLPSAIVNGRGRLPIGDTTWTIHGEDLPAGTTVRVVGADGAALKVERARVSNLG